MAYDEECLTLAEHCTQEVNTPRVKDLAQVIQDAIEDWFAENGKASPTREP